MMKVADQFTQWHWDRQVVIWFVVLLLFTSSWPLLARAQNDAQPQPAVESDAAQQPDASSSPQGLIPQQSLMMILKRGGVVMLPILACSILLLLFVFERTISLRRRKIIPKPFVKQFLHQLREGQLDRDAALEFCQKSRSVVAGVFAAAVRKWGRPAVEVEQAILDAGERAANNLRRYLRVINGVATVSPLLGLLGTVFGIMTSFNDIATANAMGRPEQLAGGISEALLTTAFGLVVAIPALIFYTYFISRVDRLVMDIDALGQEVVATISAEGLADAANRPRGKKKAA